MSLQYRLHPVTESLSGLVIYPLDQAAMSCASIATSAPRCRTRPRPSRPADARRRSRWSRWSLAITAPLRLARGSLRRRGSSAILSPISLGRCPYGVRQTLIDDPIAKHGLHRYWRSAFMDQLSDELIDEMLKGAAASSRRSACSACSTSMARQPACRRRDGVLGAAADVGFRHHRAVDRSAESSGHIAWVRELWARVEPELLGTVYINHMMGDDRPESCAPRTAKTTRD